MIIKNGKTISSIYKGNQVIEKIMKGTLVVYESFKNLIASGVPPLTLYKCKGVDLVDYKIYGNSFQQTYTGKNLWDGTFTRLTINQNTVGHTGSTNQRGYEFQSKPNTTYSVMVNTTTPSFRLGATDENYVPFVYKLYDGNTFGTITTSSDTTILAVYLGLMTSVDGITLMIVEGEYTADTMPEYEPYVGGVPAPNPEYPQEIVSLGNLVTDKNSANYGKYEIPIKVTTDASNEERTYSIYLDEPLRKVGDVSDYIDFEKGEVVRKTKQVVLTGQEKWRLWIDASFPNTFINTSFTDALYVENVKCMCDTLTAIPNHNGASNNDHNVVYLGAMETNKTLYLNVDGMEASVDNLKAWLSQHKPTIVYILATPSHTPITLPKIKLFDGVNHITVGTTIQPSNLEVVYKGKEVK